MLLYPNIDPVMAQFSIGGINFSIRWYGFFYVLSFILGYIFLWKLLNIEKLKSAETNMMELSFPL